MREGVLVRNNSYNSLILFFRAQRSCFLELENLLLKIYKWLL